MPECKTNVHVTLIGENGNAFNIIGKVRKALREAGYSELAEEYVKAATAGDYDTLLQVTGEYIIID